ncbi:beta family protein [Streptantibioticus ferralitis]|uniref:T4 beta protein n=1 Tax=Streptantibioticus ferralitis TaxID=236510 RepID=A0ABT5Z3P0_9ACTN|nr:hypothetical protein [Streptantibioticus ferralitis]MDF2258440.1 hypothetical protein [Streptantibioticus ferralitis]
MAYVPILKGKRGEFRALGEMAPAVQADVHPVLEVVNDQLLRDVMETFREHAWNQLPPGLDVAVDCSDLWRTGPVGGVWSGHPMNWLSEAFGAWLLPLIPVFRPHDPLGALAETRDVHRAHHRGATLRLLVLELSSDASAISRTCRDALRAVKLVPEQVDLLLDAGYLSGDAAVAEALPAMLHALNWAQSVPWRNVVVASGAFPRSLARMVRGRLNRVHRWDASLWHKVARSTEGKPPHFGDYGVSHPAMPMGGRGSIPNLRYTNGEVWDVYVASRRHPGNDGFFAICRELVCSDRWPAHGETVSWGDEQIARCARRERPKGGGPSEWRAWATSHHLAVITQALRSMGSP